MKFLCSILLCLTTFICACNNNSDSMNENGNPSPSGEKASIVSVASSGTENNYTFSVGISSPDTGCDQYADWWEVISEDGTLLYRRILGHSHVNEQPFVRSGGPINIASDKIVIIRAHMNTSGYGNIAYMGSVDTGFTTSELNDNFAASLENESPLPGDCAF